LKLYWTAHTLFHRQATHIIGVLSQENNRTLQNPCYCRHPKPMYNLT
jgi:hypothetical protein